ncbi:MAG: formylmethanofuran dehydrogenase [Burkholderiaceae bacterium]|nr:formylmethanofuran dehydrogenase [Burkholderiaceae bacterium]
MSAPLSVFDTSSRSDTAWTCPFCPLLCDAFEVSSSGGSLTLQGSDCPRAIRALQSFGAMPSSATPQVDGRVCDLDSAIDAAAHILAVSRQPLFGGLGTDVAGARALYRLACETGAISDAAQGGALMHGLRAMQDRGQFTTTLAEVRNRADVIVCLGGSPAVLHPEFFRRCGVGEELVAARHIVLVGEPHGDDAQSTLTRLQGTCGITVEAIRLHGDLFDTASLLTALVAGRPVRDAPASLVVLAERLRAAHYAVIVWQNPELPEHGALLVETVNQLVGVLNRSTRAAGLPLGGGNGAATVNQVFSWLSGVPLRSRAGPAGLEHEPLCFDARRVLDGGAADALLWLSSFFADAQVPALPAAARLPRVLIGHPDLAASLQALTSGAPTVFIPVSTPGIGSGGHLFRTDGVVLLPLHAVRADDTLPTAAQVLMRLTRAVQSLKQQEAST